MQKPPKAIPSETLKMIFKDVSGSNKSKWERSFEGLLSLFKFKLYTKNKIKILGTYGKNVRHNIGNNIILSCVILKIH